MPADPTAREPQPLPRVRWIGGSPAAGKSSVTRALAERHGLWAYYYDWHERDHLTRRSRRPDNGPTLAAWLNLTPDERWLRRSPAQLAESTIVSWTERFRLVLDDLTAYPADTAILVEGPGLFPALVHVLLTDPTHAIYLVPTPDFIRAVRTTRHERGQSASAATSDPPRALENIIARDILLADHIRTEAHRVGLTVLTIKGTRPIDEITAAVAQHFGLIPPERLLGRYTGDHGDLDIGLHDGRLTLRFAGRETFHPLEPCGDRLYRIASGLFAGERLVVTVSAGGEVKSLLIGCSAYVPCLKRLV
jgi:hypothetical protein